MERRFYLGIGILGFFLALCLLVTFSMAHANEPISDILEQASQEALSGDLETGASLARQAKADWQASRYGTASVADHTPMDEIDGLFAETEVFAQAKDAEHFAACCARLSVLIQAVADAHHPGWWNML